MHTRPLRLSAAPLLLLAVAAGGRAAADPAPPLTIPDFTGPRTLALQAGVGLATGSEALFVNPAALSARKRFVLDTYYLTDRRPELADTAERQDFFGGIVADSATTALAAGFGYTRAMKGLETGTLLRLGLATELGRGLSVGVLGSYTDLRGTERISGTLNLDAGLFLQISPKVSIGAAGYNLFRSDHRDFQPRGYAVGFAAGSETSLQVVGDWRVDLDRGRAGDGSVKRTNRYSVGLEYLFASAVPVRAGFQLDETSDTKWWSVGSGYVTRRVALDLAFRQSTTDPSARTITAALRVFVPQE